MLLDLCLKVLSPKSTKILSRCWQAMLDPFEGQMQREATFLAPIGAKFGHLDLYTWGAGPPKSGIFHI